MTISNTINKISYTGNGVATTFAIPFKYLSIDHLKVYQLLNDIQSTRTDWSVSNGDIVFTNPPAAGAVIIIMRQVPLTQEADYQDNEILSAETLERSFDKLTMQVQQLNEKTDRAVMVDIFDDEQASALLPNLREAVSSAANYAQISEEKSVSAENSATTATEQAQVATQKATEAVNAMADKLNIDIDDISELGIENILGLSVPKSTSEVLGSQSNLSSGTQFTAPSAGFYILYNCAAGASNRYVRIMNISNKMCGGEAVQNSLNVPASSGNWIYVGKGDVVQLDYSSGYSFTLAFNACKGSL